MRAATIIALASFFLLPQWGNAQIDLGTFYQLDGDKECKIEAHNEDSLDYVFIEMHLDDLSIVGIGVEKEKLDRVHDVFVEASKKYAEWRKVAQENKVDEFDKVMKPFVRVNTFFAYANYPDDFYWKYNVELHFRFDVHSDEHGNSKYLWTIETEGFTQDVDAPLSVGTMRLVFENQKEIDEFLRLWSSKRIQRIYDKKDATEDLFKD
ncbi:MAG: hypothetical protein SchgKO_23230 [Schleiferiaceae bacterium]